MDRILAALDPLGIAFILGSLLSLWGLWKVITDDLDLGADSTGEETPEPPGQAGGPVTPKSGSRTSGSKKAA
jgi:hypothetical protein